MFKTIKGGDDTRSGYVQYVEVILADVPEHTTFIETYNHSSDLKRPRYMHIL